MVALPNLSALSLDSHATEATGVGGEQCDPTKKRDKGKCVRFRLHPRVFESVRGRINQNKYHADSTSICILAPLPKTHGKGGRDQRYYTKSIEYSLYESLQWKTFRNKYLYYNQHDMKGTRKSRRFPWGDDIRIIPGFYGAYGWQEFPANERGKTWEYLFVKYGLQAPRSELRGRYEPDLFGAELCMEPDWDLEKYPEHTVAFIEALWDYNYDHWSYWLRKYVEDKEARAQAATDRKRARTEGEAGPSSSSSLAPEPEPEPEPGPISREQLNQNARTEKLRRRELAQQRLAEEAREWRRRAAPSPALEVRAEPVPMSPLRPVPESPGMPSNNEAEAWLRELEEAQGGAPSAPAPAPAPELPELQELPEDPSEYMDEILRDMRDNPDAYARMFA
jgi:hypothetical protein